MVKSGIDKFIGGSSLNMSRKFFLFNSIGLIAVLIFAIGLILAITHSGSLNIETCYLSELGQVEGSREYFNFTMITGGILNFIYVYYVINELVVLPFRGMKLLLLFISVSITSIGIVPATNETSLRDMIHWFFAMAYFILYPAMMLIIGKLSEIKIYYAASLVIAVCAYSFSLFPILLYERYFYGEISHIFFVNLWALVTIFIILMKVRGKFK